MSSSSSMGWLLKPAILTLALLVSSTAAQNTQCPDEYLYTQQPPEEIVCNPYELGYLKLDCAIVGQDVVDIRWFFSTDNSDSTELTNSTKYQLTPHRNEGNTGMLLTVNSLNSGDMGNYWCQGFVQDGALTQSVSFTLHSPEGYFPVPCPEAPIRRSNILCAEVIRVAATTSPATTHPVTTPPSSSPPPPTPSSTHLLSTSQETSPSATLPLTTATEQSTHPTERSTNIFLTSELTLYVVLGLVGFLGIVCCLLGVVIVVLCRRRCRGSSLSGSASKNIKFDHFSNQSEFALLSMQKYPSPPNTPYQPESSQPSGREGQRRDLSGDYAEIGPALVMNTDHLRHLHQSYTESGINPPPLPQSHPRFTAFRSSLETEVDPYNISGYENPYDLPVLPPTDSGTEPNQPDIGTGQSRNYHVLERVFPSENSIPRRDVHSEDFSESSSFSTPPNSPPHSYQTLQGTPSLPLPSLPAEEEERVQITPYEIAQERCVSRLETIPEHPYHVLEETQPSSSAMAVTEPSALVPTANPIDTSNDQDYDRLVSPPHLYHILEHSPLLNKPRIHHFHFTDYSHLEKRTSSGGDSTSISPAQTSSPTMLGQTILARSFSSESSSSDSEVFDDPQYLPSPEPRNGPSSTDVEPKVEVGAMAYRSPTQQSPSSQEAINLTKYSGDYERDPVYMRRLQSVSPRLYQGSSQLLRGSDLTGSQDDSGFCSYGKQSCHSELRRQYSLPDITHTYQPLQAKTMDPRLPYENVIRQST